MMLLLLLSYLYADGTAAAQQGFDIRSLLPFVLIFTVFYFLLIRPQQKRESDRKKMLEEIKNGDVVVTSGGFVAKFISSVSDTEVELEISEGVSVRVLRAHIIDFPGRTKNKSSKPAADQKSIAKIKEEIKEAKANNQSGAQGAKSEANIDSSKEAKKAVK